MKSLFCSVINNNGRKLKIHIAICLFLLYLINIPFCKTKKRKHFNSIDRNLFVDVKKGYNYYFDNKKNNYFSKKCKNYHKIKEVKNVNIQCKEVDEENKLQGEEKENKELFSSIPQINQKIVDFLETKGIKYMTKIQSKSFMPIYEGNDIIGRSETGSGKTLAFALPLVEKLYKNMESKKKIIKNKSNEINSIQHLSEGHKNENTDSMDKYPYILVLEPTRELSKQVETTFKEISQFYNFNIMSIYGGESYTYQENKLRKGIQILTGTPGRIIDHIEKKNLSLKNIKYVVLDEADEMLNLGFTHDIERILSYINIKDAQVLLYSATTPSWIKDISSKYLKNPIYIDVINTINKTSKTIQHIAIKTPYDIKEKAMLLEDIILVKSNGGQVIIFTRTKLEADILCSEGSFNYLTFSVLHGNIAQSTREHTMQRFRSGMFQVLIATDIAARGLDISNVDLVIQCYPPTYPAIYIHRSGRTGRANKKGMSIVLFSNEDKNDVIKIEKNCGIKFTTESLPNNEQVFHSVSKITLKKIENVNTEVLPFFHKSANELIEKSNLLNINQIDLISRCLAIISKKEYIKKRSLISGLSDTITLTFLNKKRKWKNIYDAIYWINKISNELNINVFNKILQIKINNKDQEFSYFDLNQKLAESLVQNFNNMAKIENKQTFDLSIAQTIPPQSELSSDSYRTNTYSQKKRNYSYKKRPSYY
ncbi:ATP-dependent helicase, putative [Plasmodium berghei]|uniref:RNA helicase n=2 Tax=Plasmodium berghei TaxID=5821 RepID=A0A509ALM4_PLABA|nr:ATP-dependent helicase, putative [Plasmodium berghei ANKA]CXI59796.1 ATP-dependent helicase, putative [Plasmodium berghei]SCM23498.1 ATP-dependent helicase, putative [Plasmodium berghei]SCN26618.1 ATP-dependent helicase, putative [Plasmodium berghei]SCO60886.1 ATP-dependent helicase, putative [Plasmodium berghei]SCO62897.1 ATP-dependent helicase, putative [Plasmodium berghei]|eukprot:XP_034422249.1 ATP-dependent helicase, putative [Plasmodium berghei ANKA]